MFGSKFQFFAKLNVRHGLRKLGYGFVTISGLMGGWGDGEENVANMAFSMLSSSHQAEAMKVSESAALGDGSFFAAIMAFLQSDAGKALIAIIIKLLTGGI